MLPESQGQPPFWMYRTPVNTGKNYQPQLVGWMFSMRSHGVRGRPPWRWGIQEGYRGEGPEPLGRFRRKKTDVLCQQTMKQLICWWIFVLLGVVLFFFLKFWVFSDFWSCKRSGSIKSQLPRRRKGVSNDPKKSTQNRNPTFIAVFGQSAGKMAGPRNTISTGPVILSTNSRSKSCASSFFHDWCDSGRLNSSNLFIVSFLRVRR